MTWAEVAAEVRSLLNPKDQSEAGDVQLKESETEQEFFDRVVEAISARVRKERDRQAADEDGEEETASESFQRIAKQYLNKRIVVGQPIETRKRESRKRTEVRDSRDNSAQFVADAKVAREKILRAMRTK